MDASTKKVLFWVFIGGSLWSLLATVRALQSITSNPIFALFLTLIMSIILLITFVSFSESEFINPIKKIVWGTALVGNLISSCYGNLLFAGNTHGGNPLSYLFVIIATIFTTGSLIGVSYFIYKEGVLPQIFGTGQGTQSPSAKASQAKSSTSNKSMNIWEASSKVLLFLFFAGLFGWFVSWIISKPNVQNSPFGKAVGLTPQQITPVENRTVDAKRINNRQQFVSQITKTVRVDVGTFLLLALQPGDSLSYEVNGKYKGWFANSEQDLINKKWIEFNNGKDFQSHNEVSFLEFTPNDSTRCIFVHYVYFQHNGSNGLSQSIQPFH